METNIESKVLRYLELSKKFTKRERDIYNEIQISIEDTYYNGSIVIDPIGEGSWTYTEKQPSKRELLENKLQEKLKVFDEWEEFKQLQSQLTNYFSAKEELK